LLDYQVQVELFKKLDIMVVAASADPPEKAAETVQQLNLTYPIGCGLDAKAVAARIGAYYDENLTPPYLHATGFLLRPSGKVLNAVYSCRAIGRLTPQEVTSLVEIVRSREAQQ
jgi:peroxiredoxin